MTRVPFGIPNITVLTATHIPSRVYSEVWYMAQVLWFIGSLRYASEDEDLHRRAVPGAITIKRSDTPGLTHHTICHTPGPC